MSQARSSQMNRLSQMSQMSSISQMSQVNQINQSQRSRQSQRENDDVDLETDTLLEHISKIKGYLVPMTNQLFENKLKFETPFDENTKNLIKERMVEFLQFENQLKLQQEVTAKLQFEAHQTNQDNQEIETTQQIEALIEAANLDEKYHTTYEQLKQENTFNPMNDNSYKRLIRMLGEDTNQTASEDIQMVETDFVIPIDPISKTEIVNPVRNIICDHLYDKDNFFKMFEQLKRNSVIKCPYTGCTNKKVTVNDVEEDARLKILIENAKRQQS